MGAAARSAVAGGAHLAVSVERGAVTAAALGGHGAARAGHVVLEWERRLVKSEMTNRNNPIIRRPEAKPVLNHTFIPTIMISEG